MRHNVKGRILSRQRKHRRSMLRNLAASVLMYEHVKTTLAKAKAVQPMVEQFITLGKDQTLDAKRRLIADLPELNAVKKIEEDLVPRFKNRQGGYTRIIKLGARPSDSAEMAVLELLS